MTSTGGGPPNPLDLIPGVSALEHIVGVLDTLAGDLASAMQEVAKHDPLGALGTMFAHTRKARDFIGQVSSFSWDELATYTGGTLFRSMLEIGLRLNVSEIDKEAPGAMDTVDTMITFAMLLPTAMVGLESVLKFAFGQRVSSAIAEVLGKIPEEMGLTWALGMQLDRAFETAVGQALEEAIRRQKRPTRFEWQQMRLAFRQHILDDKQLNYYLGGQGFPDDLIEIIKKLDSSQLPVAELQKLLEYGIITRGTVKQQLCRQGFSDTDVEWLLNLYVDQIETQTGVTYRNTARQLFREQLITEDAYRAILKSTHTPEMEIGDDIAAITLEQQHGRIAGIISGIKAEYRAGKLDPAQVQTRLSQLGYSSQAISDITAAWDALAPPRHMSNAKLLSYWYSGVITDRQHALDVLTANHLRQDDANFLLDHPTAGGARLHKLTPALVTQAYLDGVIPENGLEAALQNAGLRDDPLTYQAGVARFKKSRQKRPPGATIPLTVAELREAHKYGIIDDPTFVSDLENMGYSPDDALILFEIANKGPVGLGPAGGTVFATLADAITFLQGLGFTINPPPDPRIQAAEQMLASAGYTWLPPPPSGLGPVGGTS